MVSVAVAVAWLVFGAAVGVTDARHGHWRHSWVVSAMLGPFAVALAWERRHLVPPSPTVITTGRARREPVDLLLRFDGSSGSMDAPTLACKATVPVLLVPARPATSSPRTATTSATPAHR